MLNKQKIATVVLEMTVKRLTKIFLALEIRGSQYISEAYTVILFLHLWAYVITFPPSIKVNL